MEEKIGDWREKIHVETIGSRRGLYSLKSPFDPRSVKIPSEVEILPFGTVSIVVVNRDSVCPSYLTLITKPTQITFITTCPFTETLMWCLTRTHTFTSKMEFHCFPESNNSLL